MSRRILVMPEVQDRLTLKPRCGPTWRQHPVSFERGAALKRGMILVQREADCGTV